MNHRTSLLQRWLGESGAGAERVMTSNEQLLQSLLVMAWMVEARDPYTGGHLWRVAQYCRLLAQNADLPAADAARIAIGGFLHDLGKVGVPDAILNKPGRLDADEFALIMTHPEVGALILAGHPLAVPAETAVLHHHERPDGNGYPAHLSDAALPLDARIVAISDAFDAMISVRPYRRSLGRLQALSIIEENLDKQFDRHYAEGFIVLGYAGVLDQIIGHSDQGIPLQSCPVCGPTIVVRRNQYDGDLVYCRHCGHEAVVGHEDGQLCTKPTGKRGGAKALEPIPDLDVFGDLVKASQGILRC